MNRDVTLSIVSNLQVVSLSVLSGKLIPVLANFASSLQGLITLLAPPPNSRAAELIRPTGCGRVRRCCFCDFRSLLLSLFDLVQLLASVLSLSPQAGCIVARPPLRVCLPVLTFSLLFFFFFFFFFFFPSLGCIFQRNGWHITLRALENEVACRFWPCRDLCEPPGVGHLASPRGITSFASFILITFGLSLA